MSKIRARPPAPAQQNFETRRSELTSLPLDQRFERIFRTNLWGAPDSRSGLGSELDATADLRAALPGFLARHHARALLDIPCGDFNWLSRLGLQLSYTGADIVPAIVDANERTFGGPGSNRRFLQRDLTRDPLPPADIVLCRDCLVHLSFANIFRAFANIRRSGAKYLLTTTFLDHHENVDIDDGDWRILNLEKAPFNLPAPVDVLIEGCTEGGGAYSDKALGLWEVSALPAEERLPGTSGAEL
jgi:methyltransferase family protein